MVAAHHLQRCYHCSITCNKEDDLLTMESACTTKQLSNNQQYSQVPRVDFLTDGNHGIICGAIIYLWSCVQASSIWTYRHQEGLQAFDVMLSIHGSFHRNLSCGRAHIPACAR